MLVELPCGILHEGEVYDRVIVQELTGRQQDYLVDMDLVADNIGHIPKLLEDLVSDFQTAEGQPLKMDHKEAIWSLTVEDVDFILIKIRELTYGPNYAMHVACPHCGRQQRKAVALDKLETKGLKDKKARTKTIKLPKSEEEAVIRLMYLQDLFNLYKILRESKHELYTASLALSVEKIGENEEITPEDLKDVKIVDLRAIEDAWQDLKGEIDTTIVHDCDGCEEEFPTALPVADPSFFVQSQTPST